MVRRLTDQEYENLSEAELDAHLARFAAKASQQQREGGMPRSVAVVMLVCSLIGWGASLELVMSEKIRLTDPAAQLSCDISPFVSCGKWIGAWQNELLFGISNSVVGLAFFSGMTALALVLVSGGRMGRRLWQALALALTLGMVWVLWFQYESFIVQRSLCPYCYLVWLVTIALFALVWARSLQAGHWGERGARYGEALVRNRFLIVGICYAVLVMFTLVWLWEMWVF
ncbi:MAG: vitamin K epoxide reductase family protein [Actinomycetaceae bacterium]|nr:vitamin K epoxide reductase family protein [Arcanobacterium sp.]MDD7687297.1 vitamin K epoxide reductase family protein [Actinomycetaceae bacterium]MDY5273575.1 vitamin K epoxide reductase family protein [Arcanobacterium sp.]